MQRALPCPIPPGPPARSRVQLLHTTLWRLLCCLATSISVVYIKQHFSAQAILDFRFLFSAVSFLEELEVNLFHMQEHIMSPIIKINMLLILRVHVYVCVTVSHLCVSCVGVGATVFVLIC